ncbi:sensor histidine kinase [Paenibacillus sp. FSL R7-0273]|uniref:sensor histidine kinase n=1 Tax=Paenibacillus sp. FSL R7-0273 TaxID=1536772 RepID=UPI000694DE32|nr:sensor histidine kinase [Paenibacillus sp. FSL R7-0273]OMF97607.1 hypothetical protein BK144_02955 [Paenibacillus sp. FSL R7-0273]
MVEPFFNTSLKTKIVIVFVVMITLITSALGLYSFHTSKKQIVNKVSTTNLSVIRLIDNNIIEMQKSIKDWVTVFSLSPVVQDALQNEPDGNVDLESQIYSGTMSAIMNQMLVTGNFDYLSLYGQEEQPLYQVATDDSSGPGSYSGIVSSDVYKQTLEFNGASYWYPLNAANNVFIDVNRNEKIAMSRIVRSTLNGRNIGLIFVGINTETIRKRYLKDLYDESHGIMILDQNGVPFLTAGKSFYNEKEPLQLPKAGNGALDGSRIISLNGEELLLTYTQSNAGWQILYAVPLDTLTKELNSIKLFVVIAILVSLLLSIPLMLVLSNFLTAPIKKLLYSMRRFQNGHFDEKVEVRYRDEIGLLSRGYNTMVGNIKTLVDEVYVLKLKEQEAELKALQSQINPHFLYNMLDTIFWEAESAGQDKISEMVINLSRLFRLSLNRGKSFTSVAKEKELIQLYLSLQQMRFRDKLSYSIDIPDALDNLVILKLSLQPFIENALVHGIERKREGGAVSITGAMDGGYLRFVIEDNGIGMDEATIAKITEVQEEDDIHTGANTGGYAVANVIQRFRLYYKDQFNIRYSSEPGSGTRVELIIPVTSEPLEENHD